MARLSSAPALIALLVFPPVKCFQIRLPEGMCGHGAHWNTAKAADLFQRKYLETVYGVIAIGTGGGAVIGPWVRGPIFDLAGSYHLAFHPLNGPVPRQLGDVLAAAPSAFAPPSPIAAVCGVTTGRIPPAYPAA